MRLLALAWLAGNLVIQQFSVLPSNILIIMSLVGAFSAGCMTNFLKSATWIVVGMLLGFTWTSIIAQNRLDDFLPDHLEKIDLTITGIISSLPTVSENSQNFIFKVNSPSEIPKQIRLTWYDTRIPIKPGHSWKFTVRLKQPHGNLNPNG